MNHWWTKFEFDESGSYKISFGPEASPISDFPGLDFNANLKQFHLFFVNEKEVGGGGGGGGGGGSAGRVKRMYMGGLNHIQFHIGDDILEPEDLGFSVRMRSSQFHQWLKLTDIPFILFPSRNKGDDPWSLFFFCSYLLLYIFIRIYIYIYIGLYLSI